MVIPLSLLPSLSSSHLSHSFLPSFPLLPWSFFFTLSAGNTGNVISLLLGVFWIDWRSFHSFFDVIYINWRPEMFTHKSTLHELVTPNPPILPLFCFNFVTFRFPFSHFPFSHSQSPILPTVYGNPAMLRKTGMTSVSSADNLLMSHSQPPFDTHCMIAWE